MPRRSVPRFIIILTVLAAAIPLFLAGIIFHVGQLLMAVALVAFLLIAMFIPKWPTSPSTPQGRFRVLLAGSLIFIAGAADGVLHWYRDGLPWGVGLALLFPLAFAGWLLRLALRMRRTNSVNSRSLGSH
jgi:hypothetical protein